MAAHVTMYSTAVCPYCIQAERFLPQTPIIVIMQRLHEEDLAGYLIGHGSWHHLDLPAIAVDDSVIPVGHGKPAFTPAEAGKDIWCEKPMTRTIAEGRSAAAAVDTHLMGATLLPAPLSI